MFRVTLAVILTVCIVGCGSTDKSLKKRQPTFPASGSVKFNGTPVAGATVVFAPTATGEKAVAASAITDASGNFSLQTYPPLKGAVPGNYKVSITKKEDPPPAPTGPNAHDAPPPPPPKWLIPEKFADAEKSGLKAEVPEGGRNDLHFELP